MRAECGVRNGTVAGGQWPVAGGQWPVAGGRWPVASGRFSERGGGRPGGQRPEFRCQSRGRLLGISEGMQVELRLTALGRYANLKVGGSAQGLLSGGPEGIASFFFFSAGRIGIGHKYDAIGVISRPVSATLAVKLQLRKPWAEIGLDRDFCAAHRKRFFSRSLLPFNSVRNW